MFSRFTARHEQDAPVKNGGMPAPEIAAPTRTRRSRTIS